MIPIHAMLVSVRQVQQIRPWIVLEFMWFLVEVGELNRSFAGREVEETERFSALTDYGESVAVHGCIFIIAVFTSVTQMI